MKKSMNNLNVVCFFFFFLLEPYYTNTAKETTLKIQLNLILLFPGFDYNLQNSYRASVLKADFPYLPIKLWLDFWNATLASLINESSEP